MNTHGPTIYEQPDGWAISVDRWGGYVRNAVVVRVMRVTPRSVLHYAPSGEVFEDVRGPEQTGSTADLDPATFDWVLPMGAEKALASALLDREEPSDRLLSMLENTLDIERQRVDRLLTFTLTPPPGVITEGPV